MNSLWRTLRIKEIIGKAGFFMVGVLFAEPILNIDAIIRTSHFFLICIVNGVAIYLLNAGLGFNDDKTNERLHEIQRFNKSKLVSLGIIIGVVGFAWLYIFSPLLVVPALIVYSLWIIYSIPGGLKRIPLLGLLTAFVGQLVHFHLGYLVFDDLTAASLVIATYFSLLFTAGHALHEVIDHDADRKAGLRTSAVSVGRELLFHASTFLFVVAAIYLLVIYLLGAFSWTILVPYEIAFIVHMFLLRKLRDTGNESLFNYRRKYMVVYATATAVVAILINVDL